MTFGFVEHDDFHDVTFVEMCLRDSLAVKRLCRPAWLLDPSLALIVCPILIGCCAGDLSQPSVQTPPLPSEMSNWYSVMLRKPLLVYRLPTCYAEGKYLEKVIGAVQCFVIAV